MLKLFHKRIQERDIKGLRESFKAGFSFKEHANESYYENILIDAMVAKDYKLLKFAILECNMDYKNTFININRNKQYKHLYSELLYLILEKIFEYSDERFKIWVNML